MPSEDTVVKQSESVQSRGIGSVETPVVTVSDVPTTVEVGDRVKPKANVKRADGTTPIVGCPVDFFVKDSLGTMTLGNRVNTDSAGDAIATEYYYVGIPEAGLTVDFIIVTRQIKV